MQTSGMAVLEGWGADLSLWRWFFFGVTLIVVMILRPEELWPSAQRAAELHADEEIA